MSDLGAPLTIGSLLLLGRDAWPCHAAILRRQAARLRLLLLLLLLLLRHRPHGLPRWALGLGKI